MRFLPLTGASILLAGCPLVPASQRPPIDQSDVCVYSDVEEAADCNAGMLAYFRPSSWGNEQLPLDVAALYCDFNYPILQNKAGVLCVFTDARRHLE